MNNDRRDALEMFLDDLRILCHARTRRVPGCPLKFSENMFNRLVVRYSN